MGYDPSNPMEGRISDLGPPHFTKFRPPVIKNNFAKWLYHEIVQPGVLMHKAESGDEVYTVRCGSARLISIEQINGPTTPGDHKGRPYGMLDFILSNNTSAGSSL